MSMTPPAWSGGAAVPITPRPAHTVLTPQAGADVPASAPGRDGRTRWLICHVDCDHDEVL
jgi:hypothetical protein